MILFFSVLCTTYVDDDQYASFVQKNIEKSIIFKLIYCALRDGVNVQTYKRRAMLLKDIHSDKKTFQDNLISIDCSSTANYIIGKIFEGYPSYQEFITCPSCKISKTRSYTTLVANLPTDTLQFLEVLVNDMLSNSVTECKNCNLMVCEKIIKIGKNLIIETAIPFIKQKIDFNNLDLSVALENIPKRLQISTQKVYTLRGLVNFIPPVSKSPYAIGHYISYCWRDHKEVWERYDDMSKIVKSVRQSIEVRCQFLIYT